jgi:hypothetical protein
MEKSSSPAVGEAAGSTKAGGMRKQRGERMAALRRAMIGKMAAAVPMDGSDLVIIRKDKTGADHNVAVRRSWETGTDGQRKWEVSMSHHQTHTFATPEDAFNFVYGDGDGDADDGGEPGNPGNDSDTDAGFINTYGTTSIPTPSM